ncbi:hypothetical protein MESS4_360011 [Mesorhizobium sp. STM 4661]|nr:hypothetical protein MESS4_360011 [Mesorhizobium sp. STM 4661]
MAPPFAHRRNSGSTKPRRTSAQPLSVRDFVPQWPSIFASDVRQPFRFWGEQLEKLSKVEKLPQKGLLFSSAIRVGVTMLAVTCGLFATGRLARILCLHLVRGGTFDYLVEFASVQPYAAAFGAIVDLDTLTL